MISITTPRFSAVKAFPASATAYGDAFEYAYNLIRSKNPQIPDDQFNYLTAPNHGDVIIVDPDDGCLIDDKRYYVADEADGRFVSDLCRLIRKASGEAARALKETLTRYVQERAENLE